MGTVMRNKLLQILLATLFVFGVHIHLHSKDSDTVYPTVDIVYTWVNNQDLKWQKKREKTLETCDQTISCDANTKNRFRDRNELMYSLRSVYQFAAFINHIYIVTCGQKPSWIKPHPKITFINHEEIFESLNDLPTFNSMAIESHLHNIRSLSEYFIYLNDDVFFGKEVDFKDFFTKTGNIKLFLAGYWSPQGETLVEEGAWKSAWKNTNKILDNKFVPERRRCLSHAPFALRKSLIQEVQKQFPEIFSSVSSHKFRSPDDYAMTNGFIQYYALYNAQAQIGKFRDKTVRLTENARKNKGALKQLMKSQYKAFCLEDIAREDSDDTDIALKEFLEDYFPNVAPWEK